ncbi:7167_t:CDS:2 [Ambispora gerdemannii]|uniref:7167_t:CDS:1 n=1 Tax=Ambispora gerdemannii TaxID=144530 RepID=A0A9N9D108_9GLOM|nr:7167_t:CDS:2 [Ambispora gerdemannii]
MIRRCVRLRGGSWINSSSNNDIKYCDFPRVAPIFKMCKNGGKGINGCSALDVKDRMWMFFHRQSKIVATATFASGIIIIAIIDKFRPHHHRYISRITDHNQSATNQPRRQLKLTRIKATRSPSNQSTLKIAITMITAALIIAVDFFYIQEKRVVMERTFIGDKQVPKTTEIPRPSLEEVEKREAERLKDRDEQGKPKEGGSAGRVLIGAHTTADVEHKKQ